MVDQLAADWCILNVLRMSKIDPEQWNGFAFGWTHPLGDDALCD